MISFNILIVISQVLIAIIALYIAWQQHKTNKRFAEKEHLLNLKKINIELYNKRYAIYKATRKFISNIKSKGAIFDEDYLEFVNEKEEFVFLFGDDVAVFFNDLIKKAERKTEIKNLKADMDNPNCEELKKENRELFLWFCDVKLESVFMRYLDFKSLTV